MTQTTARVLFAVPGVIVASFCGAVFMSEWVRIIVLGQHSSVFVLGHPWRLTIASLQTNTVVGHGWAALGNGVLLLGYSVAVIVLLMFQVQKTTTLQAAWKVTHIRRLPKN